MNIVLVTRDGDGNLDTSCGLLGNYDPSAKRNLRTSEYLSVRHVLPKTYLHHAILHENNSQDRHLAMKMQSIRRRQIQLANSFDMSQRTFLEHQNRKHRKWKREDQIRACNMNIPMLRNENELASKVNEDPQVLYRSPRYLDAEDTSIVEGQMLPFMSIRREATEVIKRENSIYMTKLPTTVEINDLKLRRYNTYCGTELVKGGSKKDDRFLEFINLLSDRKATPEGGVIAAGVKNSTAPAGERPKPEKRKPKVVFPSLAKRFENRMKDEGSSESNTESQGRSKRLSRMEQIKQDLRNKDFNELLQTYGKLRLSPSAKKPTKPDARMADVFEEESEPCSSTEDGRQFKSPSLQLIFTVKSNMK